jgi:hypothetical protein
MAGAERMTIEEVVKRVLLYEHADVVREAVKAVGVAVVVVRDRTARRPARLVPDRARRGPTWAG